MRDFVAIDFETANNEPSSICSVGIVVVRDGMVQHREHRLVRPVPNYYCYHNKSSYWVSCIKSDCCI